MQVEEEEVQIYTAVQCDNEISSLVRKKKIEKIDVLWLRNNYVLSSLQVAKIFLNFYPTESLLDSGKGRLWSVAALQVRRKCCFVLFLMHVCVRECDGLCVDEQ